MEQRKQPKRKKQDKFTKSAKGQDCTVNYPGCSFQDGTTRFAHLRNNTTGYGTKEQNIHGAYACQHCEDIYSGLSNTNLPYFSIELHFLQAIIKTQKEMIKNGVLRL
jgi:hypothetical protein